MLVRDPAKRSSLEFLADDTWINEGCSDSPIVRDMSSAPVEEDEEIISAMIRKFPPMERETLLQSLRQNLYDDISAIYYLMYFEKQARGADFKLSPDTATGPQLLPPAPANAPTVAPTKASDVDANLPPLPSLGDKDASTGPDAAAAKAAKSKKPTSPSPSFASLPEGGQAPPTVVQHAPTAPAAPTRPANPMARIDEDAVLHSEPDHEEDSAVPAGSTITGEGRPAVPIRPNVVTMPVDSRSARRRRFTVGGEAEVARLAEAEERTQGANNGAEAAELLRKLQNLQREQQLQAQAEAEESKKLKNKPEVSMMHPASMSKMPQKSPVSAGQDAGHGSANRKLDAAQSSVQPISPNDSEKSKPRSTISGFIRSHLRRQSDNPGSTTSNAVVSQSGYNDSTYYTATMIAEVNALSISTANSTAPATGGSFTSFDDDKPRSLRFTFNSNTTSSKLPDEIVREVMLACDKTGMTFRPLGKYLLECTVVAAEPGAEGEGGAVGSDIVKFEVEVCKLPRLKNLVGVFRSIVCLISFFTSDKQNLVFSSSARSSLQACPGFFRSIQDLHRKVDGRGRFVIGLGKG